MGRIVGNRYLTNLQDSNADLDNLEMGSAITNTQNIGVLPKIYEPRYAPQPYNPHRGFYSTMNNQTRFAPDWSDSDYAAKYGYNRPYNMRDVAGEVGEYSQRPAPTINEQDQGSSGFSLWDFFPGKAMYEGIAGVLPRQDPRQIALTDFYEKRGNAPLKDGLTIQSGLMQGYNPVSGGLLNTLTGGRFGEPTNYGLQRAYDKRMSTIEKTLGNKYDLSDDEIDAVYAGTYKGNKKTALFQRLRDLQAAKDAEAAMLNKVKTGEGGTTTGGTTTGGTGDGPSTPSTSYTPPAQPGTTGSWTPGGTYTAPSNTSGGYQQKQGSHHFNQGGRAGYAFGEEVEQETDFIQGPQGGEEFQETVVEGQEQPSREQLEALAMEIFNLPVDELDEQQLLVVYQEAMQGQPMEEAVQEDEVQFAAQGGLAGLL